MAVDGCWDKSGSGSGRNAAVTVHEGVDKCPHLSALARGIEPEKPDGDAPADKLSGTDIALTRTCWVNNHTCITVIHVLTAATPPPTSQCGPAKKARRDTIPSRRSRGACAPPSSARRAYAGTKCEFLASASVRRRGHGISVPVPQPLQRQCPAFVNLTRPSNGSDPLPWDSPSMYPFRPIHSHNASSAFAASHPRTSPLPVAQ